MTAIDVSGLCLLFAAAVIAASELVISGYLWSLRPIEDDPCRVRPSSLPAWGVERGE